MKRPVRSRMQGVVEAGGEKPLAIRLSILSPQINCYDFISS